MVKVYLTPTSNLAALLAEAYGLLNSSEATELLAAIDRSDDPKHAAIQYLRTVGIDIRNT